MIVFNPILLMKFADPKPTTVEVSSVGSMKEEISVCSPIAVELRVLARNGVLTMLMRVER